MELLYQINELLMLIKPEYIGAIVFTLIPLFLFTTIHYDLKQRYVDEMIEAGAMSARMEAFDQQNPGQRISDREELFQEIAKNQAKECRYDINKSQVIVDYEIENHKITKITMTYGEIVSPVILTQSYYKANFPESLLDNAYEILREKVSKSLGKEVAFFEDKNHKEVMNEVELSLTKGGRNIFNLLSIKSS